MQTSDFSHYAQQTLKNAKAMADEFLALGYDLVTGGTDNHMMLLDFTKEEFDGGEVEKVLDKVGISVSKSLVPNDLRPAFAPSGLRIGTPAMTTRGMSESDARTVARLIDRAIEQRNNSSELAVLREEVRTFAQRFPLPE